MKKRSICWAVFFLSVVVGFGCTSKKSQQAATDDYVLDDTSGVDELDAVVPESGNVDEASSGFANALPEAPMGDTSSELTIEPPASESPSAVGDSNSLVLPPAPLDGAPLDPISPSVVDSGAGLSAPAVVSLKKIRTKPFRVGGQLLNAVYIARPGDNFRRISEIVYGSPDQRRSLIAANPAIKTIRPGDKVYYNSPNRPTDDAILLNYFDDNGIPAKTYVAQDGDKLRKVAESLLGFPRAWREIYVTNPQLDSQTDLSAGMDFRYWDAPARPILAAKPTVDPNMAAPPPGFMAGANNNGMMPPPAPNFPGSPETANGFPPPGGMSGDNSFPPPPTMNDPLAVAPPPTSDLPPPPPLDLTPPPPPPPAPVAANVNDGATAAGTTGGMDSMTLMILAGLGCLIVALLIVRSRREKKRAEMAAGFPDQNLNV